MADIAQDGRAPEYIEEADLNLKNIPNDGLGADVSDIDCDDEDEIDDIMGDDMENPLTIRKSEGDDDDDDDDDSDDGDDSDDSDDDDDTLKKQAKKGGLTAGNLQKSIANLARFVEAQDPATRRANLFRRAEMGKSLSKSEQAEILSHFRGAAEKPRRLSKGLSHNRSVQSGVDHSEYLAAQNVELCKALGHVDASLQQTAQSGMEFNLMMAKAVSAIGQDLRRLSKSMDKVLDAPASAPRSVGVNGNARPLAKSQGQLQRPSLSHQEGQAAIQGLLSKSMEMGRYGKSASGADLLKGSMHFESCGQIHPEISADVQRFLKENR